MDGAGEAWPQYQQRREAGVRRRERHQAEYVKDFRQAVLVFRAFAPRQAELAERLATAVTAPPEAAVIAWLRHQTTAGRKPRDVDPTLSTADLLRVVQERANRKTAS